MEDGGLRHYKPLDFWNDAVWTKQLRRAYNRDPEGFAGQHPELFGQHTEKDEMGMVLQCYPRGLRRDHSAPFPLNQDLAGKMVLRVRPLNDPGSIPGAHRQDTRVFVSAVTLGHRECPIKLSIHFLPVGWTKQPPFSLLAAWDSHWPEVNMQASLPDLAVRLESRFWPYLLQQFSGLKRGEVNPAKTRQAVQGFIAEVTIPALKDVFFDHRTLLGACLEEAVQRRAGRTRERTGLIRHLKLALLERG